MFQAGPVLESQVCDYFTFSTLYFFVRLSMMEIFPMNLCWYRTSQTKNETPTMCLFVE